MAADGSTRTARKDDSSRSEAGRRSGGGRSATDVAQLALRHIGGLTGKPPVGVTSVEPADGGWVVDVEVLEQSRIPSSADILALYEAEIDVEGELVSYRRTGRYPRSRSFTGGTSRDE